MSKLSCCLDGAAPYFIAEMSANHNNDLEVALSIVDAAAASGADCLKVQTYTADTLTLNCDNDYFRIKSGLWEGGNLYELYSDASFPWEWHEPVMERCKELGMDFLSTPFDESAVDFLDELGVDAFKIASFELTDIPLLEYAASKGKTMIVSTGMASLEEIGEAIEAIRGQGNEQICILRCCSEYPANPADMNLASIPDLARRFGVAVGFSDHSMGHAADVVAAVLGAKIIEKHFCLSRDIDTADSSFSMTPEEFRAMVESVKGAIASVGEPCYDPSPKEAENKVFRRSIFASADIASGEEFTRDNIRIVRPSYGAKPKFFPELLGQRADRPYRFGDPIRYGD
ncbi:pseudaminic acid synthase [Adlercreutzia caecimuris]|jgi:pseudaminic acid synthase|uniref:pseudaminic acid synthase n=1 Tax=Adlercreutzia caecimuris TaxID=671266 RepID=UPI001C3EED83|nr:pseudaminic acid synthase [Adlercreutzia caecimuris]